MQLNVYSKKMKNWIIIRTYKERYWAEEDSLKLHDMGIESKLEEVPIETLTPEIEEEGAIRLLVSQEYLEMADEFLMAEEAKLEAVVNEETSGGRRMLVGGITCLLGLLASLSPHGGVEGMAWIAVGVGAFQFMRGMYEQREEEKEVFGEGEDEDEDLAL